VDSANKKGKMMVRCLLILYLLIANSNADEADNNSSTVFHSGGLFKSRLLIESCISDFGFGIAKSFCLALQK